MLGSYHDPSVGKFDSKTPENGCVKFGAIPNGKSVYVSVYGAELSKFSIMVQTAHGSWSLEIPTLNINEDVDYTIQIPPMGSHDFILQPLHSSISIDYSSSRPMTVCLLRQ